MPTRRDQLIKRIQKLNAARQYLPFQYAEAFRERFPEYKKDKRVNKVLGFQCYDEGLIECFEQWVQELKEVKKIS